MLSTHHDGAGAAAEALLAQAGLEQGASLMQLCSAGARPHLAAGLHLVSLLGMQCALVGGRPVASLLLQRTQPAALLAPEHVSAA